MKRPIDGRVDASRFGPASETRVEGARMRAARSSSTMIWSEIQPRYSRVQSQCERIKGLTTTTNQTERELIYSTSNNNQFINRRSSIEFDSISPSLPFTTGDARKGRHFEWMIATKNNRHRAGKGGLPSMSDTSATNGGSRLPSSHSLASD